MGTLASHCAKLRKQPKANREIPSNTNQTEKNVKTQIRMSAHGGGPDMKSTICALCTDVNLDHEEDGCNGLTAVRCWVYFPSLRNIALAPIRSGRASEPFAAA